MGIWDWFIAKPKRAKKKKIKLNVANVLILREGRYCADNFDSGKDFGVGMTVISGKVKKTLLKKMKRGEDTDMFNIYKITPRTRKALLFVVKTNFVPRDMVKWKRPTLIWKILLLKNNKGREKVIKIKEIYA